MSTATRAPRSVRFTLPSEADVQEIGEVSVLNTFLHVGPSTEGLPVCASRTATAPELPSAMLLEEEESAANQFSDDEDSDLPLMTHVNTYNSYDGSCSTWDFDATADDDSQLSSHHSAPSILGSRGQLPSVPSEPKPRTSRRTAKSLSVRFSVPDNNKEDDQEIEVVSVVNTFIHVERTDRSTKQRSRTTPQRVLEAAVKEVEARDDSDNEDDSSDDESGPPMVAVKTHDPFEEAAAWDSVHPPPTRTPDLNARPMAVCPPLSGIPVVASLPLSFAACPLQGVQCLQMPGQAVQQPSPQEASQSPEASLPRLLGRAPPVAQADPAAPAKAKVASAKSKTTAANVPLVTSHDADVASSRECLKWNLDGRKLESQDKSIMSPVFEIDIPGVGATPFRLMALPRETKGKGQRGFAKAGGHSRLFVKCEVSLPAGSPELEFRLTVAPGTSHELSRCSKRHQFADASLCSMQSDAKKEVWDLASCKDSSKRVAVVLSIVEAAQ